MTNYFYKILVLVTVLVSAGFSAPLMADAGQFRLDMILAERGDADAQYYVAYAYEEGRGTKKNLDKAFEWYRKAAKQQHAAAQYKLGVMYENGMGVEADLKQAMEWYKEAAENGNTLARERMNKAAFARSEEAIKKRRIAARKEAQRKREQAEQQRRAEEQKRKQAAAAARAREAALREQQARARAARQKRAAATSSKPVTTRRVNIPDLAELVLNNKWRMESQPADFLPSASTHCLRPSETEAVCFSSEKQRVINGMRVTYTTKATLTDFNSDGSFQVRYNYNAVKLDQAGSRGMRVDPRGLKLEQGWQEPQLTARCQTSDRTNLYCRRDNIKLHYRR